MNQLCILIKFSIAALWYIPCIQCHVLGQTLLAILSWDVFVKCKVVVTSHSSWGNFVSAVQQIEKMILEICTSMQYFCQYYYLKLKICLLPSQSWRRLSPPPLLALKRNTQFTKSHFNFKLQVSSYSQTYHIFLIYGHSFLLIASFPLVLSHYIQCCH